MAQTFVASAQDPAAPLERCPHCSSDARLQAHAVYRFTCGVCGKPRLPLDGTHARTSPETARLLATAYRQRLAKFAWQFASAGAFSAAFGIGLFGLGLSHWLDFAALGNSVTALLTLIPLALGALFWSQAKKAIKGTSDAIAKAWQTTTQQLFTERGGRLTAQELARLLGLDVEHATLLLAEAEVSAWIDSPAPERLRVPDVGEDDLGLDAETTTSTTHGEPRR